MRAAMEPSEKLEVFGREPLTSLRQEPPARGEWGTMAHVSTLSFKCGALEGA